MTGDNARAGRITHLDGLRGIAILTVFAVHWARFKIPFFTGGYIGVDIFFVLSGYIITTLLVRRAPTYRAFIGDRVRRLYPPLLGLMVFGTALFAIWPRAALSFDETWKAAIASGLQLASPLLASGHGDHLGAFVITWSLAVEWYFYLAWPFVVRALSRLPRVTAARWCVGIAVVAFGLGLVEPATWFYFGPVARIGEMSAGAALAFWTLERRDLPRTVTRPMVWLAPVFIGAWTLFGTDVDSWGYRAAAFPLTVVFAVFLIAAGNGSDPSHPVVSLLQWRPLVWVGGISYTLYLWHTLPIALIPGGWYGLPMAALAVIGLALVVVTTWAGFVFLEKPFRHRRGTDLRVGLAQSDASSTGSPRT